MDFSEYIKRGRRVFDGNFSSRKTILCALAALLIILYMAPTLFRLLSKSSDQLELIHKGLSFKISKYMQQKEDFDSHILYVPPKVDDTQYIPYIGNGFIGLTADFESFIYIRNGRSLSLPVNFRPLVSLSFDGYKVEEAIVTQYLDGMVTRIQYHDSTDGNTVEVVYNTYAHRSIPSLLLQDIKITNPTNKDLVVECEQLGLKDWKSATSKTVGIQHGSGQHDYLLFSGMVPVPGNSRTVIPVSIVTLQVPQSIQVKAKLSTTLHLVTAVNYTDAVPVEKYKDFKPITEEQALISLKTAVTGNVKNLLAKHIQVWRKLWLSGFTISLSKAENAINGDLINATIYNVLSQNTAPLYEEHTTASRRESILKDLAYAEGCYGGHHTLQAERLWSSLSTIEDVNNLVAVWMMTLEKQGCHQLLRAGADGVMQAMLLSFGGLQFKNQHLEFNADPSHLHRDYYFRRLSYGNATHLNISVVVQEEDYKAVLYLALDRSDKNYYGCDAGCLDPPIQLGPKPIQFPVKLTQPLTAILYITSDKVHMEELKHTIHVKEIALAPPHEHTVIALHKHGHRWGGLPTVFWMSIIALIVIFHLFLFKLVINEYCGPEMKVRYSYNHPTTHTLKRKDSFYRGDNMGRNLSDAGFYSLAVAEVHDNCQTF